MTIEYLSIAEARRRLRGEFVELVCAELQQFAKFVSEGLTSDQAAAAMGAGPATGDLYEETLRQLLQLAANTVDPAPALGMVRTRTGAVIAPGGCRHCGIEKREHAQRWTEAARWHGFAEPTDEQRLARMRARRDQESETAPEAPGAAQDDNEGVSL